jgi:hypothetical protein
MGVCFSPFSLRQGHGGAWTVVRLLRSLSVVVRDKEVRFQ